MTEREIFLEAIELTTPEARAAYLQGACGRDVTLRRKVEELLKEHFSNDSLVAGPALEGGRPTIKLEVTPEAGPGQIIGRYKLLEKIGEGGFGEVWMAEQREPVKRRVALKIIKPGMDSRQIVARFEAERQALAMMDHPNIARIFDAGTTDPHPQPLSLHPMKGEGSSQLSALNAQLPLGLPYFVMELVRGIKITEYCDQNQLAAQERLALFIKVCQAIQHAHQKGIIHRDIKPSNILVTLHDGAPVPKVIDFGIAKATAGQVLTDQTVFTAFAQFIGTPAYISPEQAEMSGLDIDTRADIYSLGVLLYELLVGQTPFDAREMMQGGLDALRKIIREKEPLRPSTRLTQALAIAGTVGRVTPRLSSPKSPCAPLPAFSEDGAHGVTRPTQESDDETRACLLRTRLKERITAVRGDLDCIVMKCLEKDRTRRYETANGLATDIQRYITNEPIIARPPNAAYRIQKAWRRNSLVFASAAVIAAALVVGIGISSWQAIEASRARDAEKNERLAAQTERNKAQAAQTLAETSQQAEKAQRLAAQENLYASDMLLAQHVQEDGDLDLAINLLNRHRPAPGEPDLRGWEWRHLWDLCQSDEVATFATNSGIVTCLAVSPNGSLLAAAEGERVKLWSFPSGRLIDIVETNDASGSVAFSPDGKLLAFGTLSHGLKLWDIEARQEKTRFPGSYKGKGLVFSPDGSTLATCNGARPEILLWNIAKKTSRALTGYSDWIFSLVFSPDGNTLICGGLDSTIRLWSMASGEETYRLTNHTSQVKALALSVDGRTLASGGDDKTIRIWDLDARRQIMVMTNHTRSVSSLAFSPDRKTLASGSTGL